ncbi:MAG: hypothetical protein HY072_06855 [Deltaproteobacteria bacterium]|nr:hypothetical protein [Deltaproteobacteria bacterium]
MSLYFRGFKFPSLRNILARIFLTEERLLLVNAFKNTNPTLDKLSKNDFFMRATSYGLIEHDGRPSLSMTAPMEQSRCFFGDTTVVILQGGKKRVMPIKDLQTILSTDTNVYVLSSTRDVISDPKYQQASWAKISQVFSRKLKMGDKYFEITYQSEGKEPLVLKVTSLHPFFCSKQEGDGSSTSEHKLYSINGTFAHILNVKELTVGENDDIEVFTMTIPETHVYYVGPEESAVLVHNAKF